MTVNVLDVVLLVTNEKATVIEKFNEENFLVEIYRDNKFSLKDVKLEDVKKIIWNSKSA